MMKDQLSSVTEEVDKEKALKEVGEAIAKEKSTTIETAEERAKEAERVCILAG